MQVDQVLLSLGFLASVDFVSRTLNLFQTPQGDFTPLRSFDQVQGQRLHLRWPEKPPEDLQVKSPLHDKTFSESYSEILILSDILAMEACNKL